MWGGRPFMLPLPSCEEHYDFYKFNIHGYLSQFPLRLDYGRSPHAYVNQRLQIQLGLLMMSDIPLETCWAFNVLWNDKFRYQVASCWLLLLRNIMTFRCDHCRTRSFLNSKQARYAQKAAFCVCLRHSRQRFLHNYIISNSHLKFHPFFFVR